MPENWIIDGMPYGQYFQNLWFDEFDWGLNHPSNIARPNQMQFTEWSQQMLATMYQNQWNSEQERMRRMQAAGINPYAAAQGIAGSGGSQGSVASAPPSAGTGALPQMIEAGANALGSMTNGFGQVAQGISVLSKLRGEINKIDSETQLNFENMGFTKLQSRALSTQLKYMDYKERMSCYQALANYNTTVAEFDVIHQDYLNKVEECKKIIAETNVSTSLQEKIDAEIQLVDLNKQWQQLQNDFFVQHGYIAGSPFYEALRDAMVNGKSIDLDAFGDVVAGYEGKIWFARENAASEASWSRRPTNAYEATAYVGRSVGDALRNILTTNNAKSALNKIYQNVDVSAEFDEAFDEARDVLKANYRAAKKAYSSVKNSGNTMYVAELERRMNNAKDELDSFTREKFTSQLVDIYTKKLDDVRNR